MQIRCLRGMLQRKGMAATAAAGESVNFAKRAGFVGNAPKRFAATA
jgi:hypothetical protein